MRSEVFTAVIIVALGTYLMRMLPLNLMIEKQKEITFWRVNQLLGLSGPALISALLVISILPPNEFVSKEVLRRILAIITVIMVQYKWSNLGSTVMTGVVAYALLKIII